MKNLQHFVLTIFTLCLIITSVHAQRENQTSSIFYKKLAKPILDVPEGADGHDHDHDAPRRGISKYPAVKLSRARKAKVLPKKSTLWNNIAFYGGPNAKIIADLPKKSFAKSSKGYCAAPIVEPELESVYASAKAHMPLYIPYRHNKVTLWQGFYYNWDKRHGAIDYGKSGVKKGEDPTFGIYAIAAGKVIDLKWSNGGGNYVTIEHTAPNGFKYRSTYLHLRNGFDHDIAKAKKSPSAKYKKFANSNSSKLCWGTNSQKIKVKVGQKVKAGQFIAWGGNTGSGGIGIILKDNGKLKKATNSYNVHLHFELRIKDTRRGHTNKWVKIDPYGVYNKKSGIDCYDLDSETPYARLFAPFYPSFHNVPLSLVNKYWGYYTGMGMALQTISVARQKGKLMAAGSFQWGLPNSWYARFYMTGETYQKYFDQYGKKGFRPRQIQVTNDSKGKARFSVIWEKSPKGQPSYSFHNRSDKNFDGLWKTYIKSKKWHLAEHITYAVNGKRYHAGIFVKKSNNGFYMYYGLNNKDFDKKFKDLYKKWQLTSMHIQGSKVGGVWRPKGKNVAAYYGMTSSDYQKKFNKFSSQGMRLSRVQNYAGNTRFAAIWTK